jgi:hypothetical protein
LIDLHEEFAVFLVLLLVNGVAGCVRLGPVPFFRQFAAKLVTAYGWLVGRRINAYVLLLLWLILAQGVGWAGALMTYGWSGLVRIQTGQ